MDSFAEQLLKKRNGLKENLIISLIISAMVLVCALAVMFLLPIPALCLMLIFGAIYGGLWLIKTQHIEYEYSVLNGDLDIDRITGKRKRKRVVQVRAQKIDEFLPVPDEMDTKGFGRVLFACTAPENATFYVTYHSKKNGRTIVFLEPNERVLKELYAGQNRPKQLALEKACRELNVELPSLGN